jgi:hypothetical protein
VPFDDFTSTSDPVVDRLANAVEGEVERCEYLRREALAFADQTEEKVLRPDVVVIEAPSFLLREDDHAPRPVGESLEHTARR